MPWQRPLPQAPAAATSAPTVARALAGSGWPGRTACGAGMSCSGKLPAGVDRRSACTRSSGRPRRLAADRSASLSPNPSSSASQLRWSARAHSSGPTPAGSPGTSASRGRCVISTGVRGASGSRGGTDVDEGLAAHLAQEAVPLVFQLALADGLAHLVAAVLLAHAGLAAAGALDDVPAGLALERRGHLAVLQGRDLVAELRAEGLVHEPAEIAAGLARGGIVGGVAGHGGEVLAGGHTCAQRIDARAGRGVVAAHQDVAG